MLNTINNQREETKTIMGYYHTATRMAKIKRLTVPSVGEKVDFHTFLVRM